MRTTTTPLIDAELLAKTMRKYFGIQLKPMVRPMYKKSYPKWVDYMITFLKRYKAPYFSTFSSEDDKSTMEHIGQFTAQSS